MDENFQIGIVVSICSNTCRRPGFEISIGSVVYRIRGSVWHHKERDILFLQGWAADVAPLPTTQAEWEVFSMLYPDVEVTNAK